MILARGKHKLKHSVLDILPAVSPAWGRVLLSRHRTVEILRDYEIVSSTPPSVSLPRSNSVSGVPFFSGHDGQGGEVPIGFGPDCVWSLRTGEAISDLRVLSTGTVVLDGKFHLDLDFTSVRGLLLPHKVVRSEEALIACWPHGWGTYYDFTMFVVTKLLRIEHALGPSVWKEARLAYPRRHAVYEREFLQALGIDEDSVIDTRSLGGAVGARQVVVANNHTRLYPSPADVCRLRDRFAPVGAGRGSRRLYLSRSGTRRVVNESDLRPILDRFGIEFVEDVPRSLPEQIDLFRAASLIVGPHGAAFTNIAWTPPGATVLELFNRAYFPPFFYYLSRVLGHDYACWIEPGGGPPNDASRHDDLHVDPDGFLRLLETAVNRAELR
jgi:Glycosyltransferase 61